MHCLSNWQVILDFEPEVGLRDIQIIICSVKNLISVMFVQFVLSKVYI